ncbi:MAG: DUF3881 family protein [Lachnospiraceae bacterium]|nr:DUF3881 family protein [Lachnospiraceae bacterium]
MHSYLRAVGFSDVHDITQLNLLIDEIVRFSTAKTVFEGSDGRLHAEISREFGDRIGLTVCGEYDQNGMFYAEYVFPYFRGKNESSYESVVIEKHVANDSCCGACDDLRVGATLIFYLQNMAEYAVRTLQRKKRNEIRATVFSALSMDGTVLLPVEKDESAAAEEQTGIDREQLLQAAREGDAEAIEYLSEEDFDTYSMLIERVSREDVLSIVDTYFMPNGSDCECYSVLGTIQSVEKTVNRATGEEIVALTLECNGITMDVAINAGDLVGEPREGRRFRGTIWLMGQVLFED